MKIKLGDREHDAVTVDVNQSQEHWNTYVLEDGTVLKLKSVLSSVLGVSGAYDADGNPVYIVKSSNVVTVESPDNLKKKS